MKPTTANALKNAFQRKLHPQLPLDRRQSQQLLELISSSFRQKLNQEHTSDHPTTTRPIDRHIQSILSNPLFQSPGSSTRRNSTPSTQLSEQIAAVASPVAFFNQQAALGKVTLKVATHVLVAAENKRQRSHNPSELDVHEADESVEVVLNWLWAKGLDNSLEFLADHRFTRAIARCLASAGRDEVFWRWFGKLQERLSTEIQDSKSAFTRNNIGTLKLLTERFIRRRFHLATTADEAAQDLVKLAEYPIPDRELRRLLLRSASSWFSWQLLHRPEGEVLSATVVDRLLSNKALTSALSDTSRAVIELFMPTPNASRAADYLSQELVWLTQHDASPKERWRRILFSLRTINALLDQDRQQDAVRIVTVLRKYYPQEIRSQLPDRISPEAAESIQARWEDLLSTQATAFSP